MEGGDMEGGLGMKTYPVWCMMWRWAKSVCRMWSIQFDWNGDYWEIRMNMWARKQPPEDLWALDWGLRHLCCWQPDVTELESRWCCPGGELISESPWGSKAKQRERSQTGCSNLWGGWKTIKDLGVPSFKYIEGLLDVTMQVGDLSVRCGKGMYYFKTFIFNGKEL